MSIVMQESAGRATFLMTACRVAAHRRRHRTGGLKSTRRRPITVMTPGRTPAMTQRIQSTGMSPTITAIDPGPAASRSARASDSLSAPLPTDQVKLSGESTLLTQARSQPSREASFDQARVDAVRAALKAGTYRIDPQEIASRLSNLEQELRG